MAANDEASQSLNSAIAEARTSSADQTLAAPPSKMSAPGDDANGEKQQQQQQQSRKTAEPAKRERGDFKKQRGNKTSNSERKRKQQADNKGRKSDDWREFKRRKRNVNGDGDGGGGGSASKNPFSETEIAAEERRPKRKVAVMIGYDGTGYRGMQVNGDDPTIERDLFRAFINAGAISKANADDPRKSSLARCARTDKGVHAAGNVISLKLIIEDPDIVSKINEHLPEQIRVWGIQRTNNSFNCYQTCDSRWYEYLMPSYCLLPPHPRTYLAQRLTELARERGTEAELTECAADVSDFWARVDEDDIQPILSALDPDVRAAVLEKMHDSESDGVDGAIGTAEGQAKGAEAKGAEPKTEPTPAKPTAESDTATKGESQVDSEAAVARQDAHNGTAEPQQTNAAPAPVAKSRGREITPADVALREIKAAYIAAKRRYRIGPRRLQRLQEALDVYTGTHNFHNFTVQKAFSDASAKRHVKSFVVDPTPVLIGSTEWLSLKVHGQSFMMHQIRKMVGMASLVVRCGTPLGRVRESYGPRKIAIPKAPGLGLLLEKPVFESYNRRARDAFGRASIDFGEYDEQLRAFKDKYIYARIFDVEERDSVFHAFYNQIDQFKSEHFLWLTTGEMGAADTGKDIGESSGANSTTLQDVNRQLGDEDEDPEGGEG